MNFLSGIAMIDSYVWIEAHSAREHTVSETTPARSATGCGIVTKGECSCTHGSTTGKFRTCPQHLVVLVLLWHAQISASGTHPGLAGRRSLPGVTLRAPAYSTVVRSTAAASRSVWAQASVSPAPPRWLLCTSAAFVGQTGPHRIVTESVGARSVGCKGPSLTLACCRRHRRRCLQAPPTPLS